MNSAVTDEALAMNGRRGPTDVLLILLVVGLGMCLGLALAYWAPISSFSVVAESGDQAATPLAVVISRLIFAAITVAAFALLGWFCLRSLRRARNRDDS